MEARPGAFAGSSRTRRLVGMRRYKETERATEVHTNVRARPGCMNANDGWQTGPGTWRDMNVPVSVFNPQRWMAKRVGPLHALKSMPTSHHACTDTG